MDSTGNICLVYMDNIVVVGPMVTETMRYLSPLSEVMFLGHLASKWGVDTDPGKITALTQRPILRIRWLLPGVCA